MNNLSEAAKQLSDRAKSALIHAAGPHQGAKIGWSSPAALRELELAGLITHNHNLTRLGTIERERVIRAAEDAAFA